MTEMVIINWSELDTVLLDLDGTLLDLHYDNYFWLEHVPKRWALLSGQSEQQCRQHLHQSYEQMRGTLEWYCLDYWSERLQLDVVALKKEVQHKIGLRPHAERFLNFLRTQDKEVILVTNGHRDGLNLKLDVTGLGHHFDQIVSCHDFKVPKERDSFWTQLCELHPFDPDRTLFIDDNESVLRSARQYGIRELLQILQPDMQQPAKRLGNFSGIHHFSELLD